MKNSILLGVGILMLGSTKAQWSIGPSVSPTYALGVGGFIAPGVTADFVINENLMFRASLFYALPKKSTDVTEARAFSSATQPQYISVNESDKLSFWGAHFEYKRYFGDADFESGGWYFTAGPGLAAATLKVKFADYDHQKYSVTGISGEEAGYKVSAYQLYLRASIGREILLGNDHKIGFDFFLNVPVTSDETDASGNTYSTYSLPIFTGLNICYIIPIGL